MLDDSLLLDLVSRALQEDAPWGDVTSEALVPAAARCSASFVARTDGVMAAGRVISAVFDKLDGDSKVSMSVGDGESFRTGDTLATVTASTQSVLKGERVALNLLQRACGVATLTRQYVDAVAGTNARIVDTRKTTPGLRFLEKHAVVCGGGANHRFSLSDAVLVKDNHLAAILADGIDIAAALASLRDRVPHTTHIEVEVDRLDQIDQVLASGVVGTILLDNFSLDDLREAVRMIDGRARTEASGNVTLDTVRAVAETGVDLIAVGRLTHSAAALDIGLDFP